MTSQLPTTTAHWNHVAGNWQYFGCPLRPTEQDLDIMQREVVDWTQDRARPPRALLLGVTPEIATMAWPEGTELLSVERSQLMIDHVWPGDTPWRRAICDNWCDFDLAGDWDVIIGDGCFILMDYPEGYSTLANLLGQLLSQDGRFIMRFFTRPDIPESVSDVMADLNAGKISSFHVFKWRLAMAVQGDTCNVKLNDIWRAWDDCKSLCNIPEGTGWSEAELRTIQLYRERENCFAFSNLKEVEETLARTFDLSAPHYGSYELAERCPVFVLHR